MKFKPFCVKYEDWMTDEQVDSVLEKAVSAGARRRYGVVGLDKPAKYFFTPSDWRYFGVTEYNNTDSYDCRLDFGEDAVLITLDQVDAHLGLTNPDPVAEIPMQPKSLTNVKLDCRKPDGNVDEELSRAFQEACFEQGIEWRYSGAGVDHLDAGFLFTDENFLTFVNRGEYYFKNDSNQEIKFTYERKLVWDYEIVAKEEPTERKVVTIGGVEYYEDMIAPLLEAMQSAKVAVGDNVVSPMAGGGTPPSTKINNVLGIAY